LSFDDFNKDKNKNDIEEKALSHIKKCLSEFNKWCLEKEITLCKSNDEFVTKLKEYKNKNAIRLGFGIGTTYQTLIKLIEENDRELFFKIKKILRLGRYVSIYPKSIEFTAKNESLGWLEWECC